ncbi:MAG: hypothetical protein JSR79_03045, partial [Proteobacteria bacterium]|nr:hypothetical protein [Pseudomonadota bacterium]
LPLIGLAMAIAFGATAWLAASFSARPPRGERLLSAALLVAMIVPGLSPQMQPQDFAVATGLSLILAYRAHEPMIGALVIGSWLLAIFVSPVIGATPMIVATLLVARPFLASPANDNGLPLNPVMAYPG